MDTKGSVENSVLYVQYGCLFPDLFSFGLSILEPLHAHHPPLLVHARDGSFMDTTCRHSSTLLQYAEIIVYLARV